MTTYKIAYTKAGQYESYIDGDLYEIWDEKANNDFYTIVKFEDGISNYIGSYATKEQAEAELKLLNN